MSSATKIEPLYEINKTYEYTGTLWYEGKRFIPRHVTDIQWMESYANAGGHWTLMVACKACSELKRIDCWCECPAGLKGRDEFHAMLTRMDAD